MIVVSNEQVRGLSEQMHIRHFRTGDEAALHAVFLSAVHEIAINDYTEEQVNAWAPRSLDPEAWITLMRRISPFVVELEGRPIAYADLQPDGHIDHFYVSGPVARRGVGTMLMNRIHEEARIRGVRILTSEVSRTAQPFFRKFGFEILAYRVRNVCGVAVPNASMIKDLTSG